MVAQSNVKTVSIAAGESLSDAIHLEFSRLDHILMPATWTAASLTFSVSFDGTTYYDLYNEGTEYSVTAGVDRAIILNKDLFRGIRYIQVRSGTSAAAVNQVAQADLQLVSVE